MVSTPLNNISQIGSSPQVGMKIKNIWNHHLEQSYREVSQSANPENHKFMEFHDLHKTTARMASLEAQPKTGFHRSEDFDAEMRAFTATLTSRQSSIL